MECVNKMTEPCTHRVKHGYDFYEKEVLKYMGAAWNFVPFCETDLDWEILPGKKHKSDFADVIMDKCHSTIQDFMQPIPYVSDSEDCQVNFLGMVTCMLNSVVRSVYEGLLEAGVDWGNDVDSDEVDELIFKDMEFAPFSDKNTWSEGGAYFLTPKRLKNKMLRDYLQSYVVRMVVETGMFQMVCDRNITQVLMDLKIVNATECMKKLTFIVVY